ncbi:apolipoprotein N-acyltransferase [Thiospirochaeta perfilievii]|uniref:Apolipoprotein N-acyltransferase n=1 Tax=Thiospirochaeta perfilievii TaxID=252967 RepID=A0A5C1QER4_9SPIO|nr:apolipoprotein N-acyltransferase [Thiospirochaeta perfilievii]QEN05184.1 apolipoprotein N-acyltransferase [Thiospirochaeta perfilievii]
MLLFALSFPGYFNSDGLAFLSFLVPIPLYVLVGRINYKESVLYGFTYGSGSYLLFNYWLKSFDPVSFSVLPTIIGSYYLLLFLLLKFIYNNFKRFTYIPLTLSWLAFEIFKGENIIGYTYGTIAHSMYKTHIFTGISDITGVYVLSLLIIYPGVFISFLIIRGKNSISSRELKLNIIIYFLILSSSIIYTLINRVDYSKSDTIRTSLVQHNIDSWATGSNQVYKETLDELINLSNRSRDLEPELIIWSETAFVPALEWHKKHKKNMFRFNLVERLEKYISDYNTDFIFGANETIGLEEGEQVFYNSAYNYSPNEKTEKYRKNVLVPFTERFPFPNLLPWLHSYIKSIGGKDLTPGEEVNNFNVNQYNLTPLICYEDTFGYQVRKGISSGGDLIVNMTNDAWSSEEACSKQHLSAALFRSIENRRSFIRVGTGGYSCVIDPNGKILVSIPVLTKGELTYDVPVYNDKTTFYTKYGGVVQYILLSILIILILSRPIKSILPALQQE